jgi:hypothetical protein
MRLNDVASTTPASLRSIVLERRVRSRAVPLYMLAAALFGADSGIAFDGVHVWVVNRDDDTVMEL